MSGGAIFEYGWREDHARAGDLALKAATVGMEELSKGGGTPADEMTARMSNVQALTAIAQAHYAAANVRTRPIRDAELRLPFNFKALLEDSYSTGPRREGGCPIARFDHASPPYGPQCEWPVGHAGDHIFPT